MILSPSAIAGVKYVYRAIKTRGFGRLPCPKVQLLVSPEKEMIVCQVKDGIHNNKKLLPFSPQRVTNKIMHVLVEQTHMKKSSQQN